MPSRRLRRLDAPLVGACSRMEATKWAFIREGVCSNILVVKGSVCHGGLSSTLNLRLNMEDTIVRLAGGVGL